jgi:hypothetical protein
MPPRQTKNNQIPIFFIIGRPRSGTTLLRYLFDAHPNVIIPEECNFLLTLSLSYKNTKEFTPEIINQFRKDLEGTLHFKSLSIDLKKLNENFTKLPKNTELCDLFLAIHNACSSINLKEDILIRGDKNPAYSSELFDKLFPFYPESKYIHIIRDYHDHIASTIRAKLAIPSAVFLAISWKKSINRLEHYKKMKPHNFYTIKYEDFVENPKALMMEMCQFIEIPFHEHVFNFHSEKDKYYSHQPNIDFSTYHQSLFNPVNKSRIGNWKSTLSKDELIAIEKIAGKTGEKYGYTYTKHKWTPKISLLILKWYFYYYLFVLIRKFVFMIPIGKRYRIVEKLSKTRILRSIYLFVLRRKEPIHS